VLRPVAAPAVSRRGATVVSAGVLVIVLCVLAWLLPVPYVAMGPGPAVNTLGSPGGTNVIEVTGHRTYPTNGRLDLTTVTMTSPDSKLSLIGVVKSWLDPAAAVVPRTYVYPQGQTPTQVRKQNTVEMTDSQQIAVAAGLAAADIPVRATVVVVKVLPGTPSVGKLKPKDRLVSVQGKPVRSAIGLRNAIRKHKPGDTIDLGIIRDGVRRTVRIVAGKAQDDPHVAAVGIETAVTGYQSHTKVKVNLPEVIGGPSAGMMFALAIYDKVKPGPLAGGRVVAGTGTIDAAGSVGPIGGIQQKIHGARDAGATVFLAPAGDCADAGRAQVSGITVYRVQTLDDSIKVLTELDKNEPVTVPQCTAP
jgi:PDZ domain-containing protein